MEAKKEKALLALLNNPTKAEAAKACGITTRTLQNYLTDPEFMERYREAYQELLEETAKSAQQRISPAFHTLQQIIESPSENGQTRVSAIRTLFEYSLKLIDITDTQKEIRELRQVIKDMENERKQKNY